MSHTKLPSVTGIDHVHIYVSDRQQAQRWYTDILGYSKVEHLAAWAEGGGPLTLANPEHNVHLALFERASPRGSSALAFGATGSEFLNWHTYLGSKNIRLRVADHELAFSLYFEDPDNNAHEITTYEHELVRNELVSS